jgi:quercetin dioxygenase-like cupin family protein
MKIIHYSEASPKPFEGDTVKGVTGRVAIGKTDGAKNFCMRVFELSQNGFTPRHTHEWEHEIFVHSGKAEVFLEKQWHPIQTGYTVFIPGGKEHQIRNTGDEKLIFICLIPSGVPEL